MSCIKYNINSFQCLSFRNIALHLINNSVTSLYNQFVHFTSSLHCFLSSSSAKANPYPGISTIWNNLPTLKKLSCCVRPGLSDVRTIVDSATELIKLDLPTFERPTNAISSNDSGGMEVGTLAPAKNESKGN